MKKLVPIAGLLVFATSCTFYDVEPRYDSRENFVGHYDVEEYSETYNDVTYYEMRISRSRRDREVHLDNFYAAGLRVYAVVSFDDLRIPFQIVDGFEVEGSGTLHRNELSLRYRVKDIYSHTVADYCETVAWR